jgi:flagellar M-ring protein FliF
MERQLEVLDFVQRASVSTSVPQRSLGRKAEPQTVAVMLQLRGGTELTRAQSQTVAQLVRFRFDVPASNVMLSDQHGNSLYGGGDDGDGAPEGDDLFEHKQRYDEDLARRTNGVLEKMFGEGKAYVLVNTDWSWQDTETVTERYDPKGVVVSESKTRTETPQVGAPAVGGPAGTASNLATNFGSSDASGAAAPTVEAPVATTSEESKQSLVGRETQLARSRTPRLERMAVSLFIDETVVAESDALKGSVQASVGFDETRGDVFSAMVTPFASLRDAEGNILEPEVPAPIEEPNALLEILLGRGVEILAALAFYGFHWQKLLS